MPSNPSLQKRWFTLASALGIGTALLGTGLYLFLEIQHREQHLQNLAAVLSRTMVNEPANNSTADPQLNQQQLRWRLAAAEIDPLIITACLHDADNNVLATYYRAQSKGPVCESSAAPGWREYVKKVSRANGIQVAVYAPRSEIIGVILQVSLPVLLAVALLLLLILAAAYYLTSTALQPIKRLTDNALNFDPQAPALQTIADTPQEVGDLANAFNRVIDSLLSTQYALREEVSQRRTAEDAERAARELLRNIVDQVPYLIFAQHANGELIFANQAVADLYGTSLDALLDGSFQQSFSTVKPDGLLFASSNRTTQAEELWFSNANNDALRFLVTRVPYLTGSARLIIGVDVTEEHRLPMQLQFSQRLEVIGTLAGGIAHDFNNLLTPILGYTSMLKEMDLPQEVLVKLGAVESAARRARDVVVQILTFSRQQQTIPSRTAMDIVPIIDDAVELMRASIPATVQIRKDFKPIDEVVVDSSQLHQVLVNLCTNAAHAARGGNVQIDVCLYELPPESPLIPTHLSPGHYACIEVRDNAEGIPRDVLSHIFEPFFTTKNIGEGSGLGLSVVHGIVTSHGGGISVESEEGTGTTFRVFLPLAGRANPNTAQSGEVMLVDDEESVLRVTAELLRLQGFTVRTFSRPADALSAFRNSPERFDVLVTDHNMPGMTGAELARMIRTIRPDLPIILITGFATSSLDELEAIDQKIMKPIAGRTLAMTIQQCLAKGNHAA